MAKQAGTIKIIGTIDDITFYMMDGIYYARAKSSLTGKRFWKDPAFSRSRASALALGKASPLASKLYRTLPKEIKSRELFCSLVGQIKKMIIRGYDDDMITLWFLETYHAPIYVVNETKSEKSTSENKSAFIPALVEWKSKDLIKYHSNKSKIKLVPLLE